MGAACCKSGSAKGIDENGLPINDINNVNNQNLLMDNHEVRILKINGQKPKSKKGDQAFNKFL